MSQGGQELTVDCEPKICEVGGGGLFLPFIPGEQEWGSTLRGVLYLCGLLYLFMGVAIVADVFMGAIETITSKTISIVNKKGRRTTVKVWNATVANLTLMALGSSAPEILLSVIELLSGGFFSGELGPSTIVGSAAFNLHCIVAVCVAAIPEGQERKIADLNVFLVTASFSILAYLWLYFIVLLNSKDVIEVWEGVLTFVFFPILVVLAYLADKGYCGSRAVVATTVKRSTGAAEMSEDDLAKLKNEAIRDYGDLSDKELAKVLEKKAPVPRSRAAYRVQATRELFGGQRVRSEVRLGNDLNYRSPGEAQPHHADVDQKGTCNEASAGDNVGKAPAVNGTDPGDVYFEDPEHPGSEEPGSEMRVMEKVHSEWRAPIVRRKGGTCGKVTCDYHTEDDSAIRDEDFIHVAGTLVFEDGNATPNEPIRIEILPKGKYEGTEEFRLVLDNIKNGRFLREGDGGEKGNQILTIVIETNPAEKTRLDRVRGHLGLNYDKAKLGYHNYKAQIVGALAINGRHPCYLGGPNEEPRGNPDGEGERGAQDEKLLGRTENEDGEEGEPTCFDYTMHFISLPWKLLFALIPPAGCCGGWVCFIVSLSGIGLVTAFIGDLAALLGCVLGIPDSITAITFVALGTSLPDTFASKSAAVQDESADASIGNVTGSNSVNVFLGLGLPWLIGSLYWTMTGRTPEWQHRYGHEADFDSWNTGGGKFIVIGGDLGFSVGVFSVTAVINLSVIFLRRQVDSELGGQKIGLKWATSIFLVALWLVYVGLSSWKTLSVHGEDPCS